MFLITGSWRFPSCVHLFKHLSYQTVVLFPSNIKQERGSKHIILQKLISTSIQKSYIYLKYIFEQHISALVLN